MRAGDSTPDRGGARPSRRKRKRDRQRAAQAARRRGDREGPPPGGEGGAVSGLWADASLSDLRLLRRAIREGWPVPEERCGPILEEVLDSAGEGKLPFRRLIALFRVALAADRDNLARARAAVGR